MANQQQYYQTLKVTGTANQTVYGTSVYASEAQPKYVEGVWIITSARQSNLVLINLERENLAQLYDDVVSLQTDVPKIFIPLNFQLPIGQALQFGIQSGATATDLTVIIQYQESSSG